MSYQISLFLENFVGNLVKKVNSNLESAKKATLERIVKDTEPYVPYKTGNLNDNVTVNTSASSFTYEAEYASYAFDPISPSGKPKQYTKEVHPQAQGYPFEKAVNEHDVDWVETFREELMRDV